MILSADGSLIARGGVKREDPLIPASVLVELTTPFEQKSGNVSGSPLVLLDMCKDRVSCDWRVVTLGFAQFVGTAVRRSGSDALVGVLVALDHRDRAEPFEEAELQAFDLAADLIADALTDTVVNGTLVPQAGGGALAQAGDGAAAERQAAMRGEMLDSFAELVTQNTMDMISVHDLTEEGRYLYVSWPCSLLLGYEPAEMLGKPAAYYFHPDDLPGNRKLHDDVLQDLPLNGTQRNSDSLRLRRKDGTYVWCEVSTKSTSAGFVCVTRDDTHRHLLQQNLRENLQKYELLASHSPDMVTMHELDDRLTIRYASQASEAILGFEQQGLVGQSLSDLYHPEDAPIVQARHSEILSAYKRGESADTVTSSHIVRLCRKDGQYASVDISLKWAFANSPPTVVGISRDVTERKTLEAERASALERHELLSRHTADIISLHAVSENFEFLYVSASVQIILGFSEKDLIGRPLFELVHAEDLIAWHTVTCAVNDGAIVSNLTPRASREISPSMLRKAVSKESTDASRSLDASWNADAGGTDDEGGGGTEPARRRPSWTVSRSPRPYCRPQIYARVLLCVPSVSSDPYRHACCSAQEIVTSATAPTTMDYRMRRKDGSWVWVETVLKAAGSRGFACVTREITQRKEAEINTKQMMHEMCRSHTEEQSALLSSTLAAVLIVTNEATTLHLSPTSQRRLLATDASQEGSDGRDDGKPASLPLPSAKLIPPSDIDHLHGALTAVHAMHLAARIGGDDAPATRCLGAGEGVRLTWRLPCTLGSGRQRESADSSSGSEAGSSGGYWCASGRATLSNATLEACSPP